MDTYISYQDEKLKFLENIMRKEDLLNLISTEQIEFERRDIKVRFGRDGENSTFFESYKIQF